VGECGLVPFAPPEHCEQCRDFDRDHRALTHKWILTHLTGKRQQDALALTHTTPTINGERR